MASYTPQQFVGKLKELDKAVTGIVPKQALGKASLVVKRNILVLAPARLSGVGKKGARLGVRYRVFEHGTTAESFIKATGPFHLIERNTKAGERVPRRGRFFVVPNATEGDGHGPRGVRASIQHPGTKGKHPFERGSKASIPEVHKIFQTDTYIAARRVF